MVEFGYVIAIFLSCSYPDRREISPAFYFDQRTYKATEKHAVYMINFLEENKNCLVVDYEISNWMQIGGPK